MSDHIDKLEVLVLKAKKKAGPMGVLAFAIGLIRQLVNEPDTPAEEKLQYISDVLGLVRKHTKL